MLQAERYEKILDVLSSKGAVKVVTLAEELDISQSTVRRDINELAKQGKLKKVFGGAVTAARRINTVDEDIAIKASRQVEEKKTVAKHAVSLIEDYDFVFIDAGTTTENMLEFLDNYTATYVTNSMTVGYELAQRGFKVYVPGGKVKKITNSIYGTEAVNFLRNLNFSKCFIGVNGVDIERGYSTPDLEEAQVKREAMIHSNQCYILADSSKFGSVSAASFANIEDAIIITDELPDRTYRKYTEIEVLEEQK